MTIRPVEDARSPQQRPARRQEKSDFSRWFSQSGSNINEKPAERLNKFIRPRLSAEDFLILAQEQQKITRERISLYEKSGLATPYDDAAGKFAGDDNQYEFDFFGDLAGTTH